MHARAKALTSIQDSRQLPDTVISMGPFVASTIRPALAAPAKAVAESSVARMKVFMVFSCLWFVSLVALPGSLRSMPRVTLPPAWRFRPRDFVFAAHNAVTRAGVL